MKSTETLTHKQGTPLTQSRSRLFEARDLALGGLLGALALVLPIAFHALGPKVGPIFLPMYYPILALGLLASWEVALIIGVLAPVLSSLLTGMPPPPYAVLMVFELAALGAVASLARRMRLGIWPASITAIVFARLIGVAIIVTLLPMIGITKDVHAYALAAVLTSLPGNIIMLTVVPAAVYIVECTSILGHRSTHTTPESE